MFDSVELYYVLVVVGVFLCSCSQLLLKKSAGKIYNKFMYSILNWRVLLAYSVSFAALFINITAMSKGVNVKDLPILESFGYIFVPILSFLVLKERFSIRILLSMILIVSGIIVFYL